jgi:hypothetical protein
MLKGQAAVEYITTYGWALLALVIVIAVLLSSGILSPNYVISEECDFGTNAPCDFALFNEGTATKMSLRVSNGFSYRINVSSLELKADDGSTVAWAGAAPPLLLESGESITLSGALSRTVAPGTVMRFIGNITYASCAPEINGSDCGVLVHSMLGRVTGKVLTQ